MNCPSRTDPTSSDEHNQSPNALNADTTTRADLGIMANRRARSDHRIGCHLTDDDIAMQQRQAHGTDRDLQSKALDGFCRRSDAARQSAAAPYEASIELSGVVREDQEALRPKRMEMFGATIDVIRKYMKFVGPGFMVAVAYIDPGAFL